MQGTQSNFILDMTGRLGGATTQRPNEAVLATMGEEEAGHSRPAWLRRWLSEDELSDESRGRVDSPREVRQDDAGFSKAASDRVSGCGNQSIEAPLVYEAIFQFNSEFEAENTEGWLDLSDQNGGGREPETLRGAAREEVPPPADTNRHSAREEGAVEDSATSPDPKSVRAAIFRLAQGASNLRYRSETQTVEKPLAGTFGEEIPAPAAAHADFADVARKVWGSERRPEELQAIDADGYSRIGATVDPAPTEWTASTSGFSIAELAEPEGMPEASPSDVPPACQADAEVVTATPTVAAPQAVSREAPLPPAEKLESGHRIEQVMASGAPALAHDAGNLLSALKLYSELLALSGVLQARHSHYAEDLKLLAARSEVLIHRLLQHFTLAQHETQNLGAQDNLSREAAQVLVEGGHETVGAAPSSRNSSAVQPENSDTEATDLISTFAERQTNEAQQLNSSELQAAGQGLRYWTEERLGSARDAVVQRAGGGQTTAPDEAGLNDLGHGDTPGLTASTSAEEAVRPTEMLSDEANSSIAPINLVELLTRWGSLLPMIARGPVQVRFGPHASLPIRVAEQALERILVNLVHNSMVATREGGSIRIGVGRSETRRQTAAASALFEVLPPSKMILTVDDSGCGMSERQVARLLSNGPRGENKGLLRRTQPVTNADASAATNRVPGGEGLSPSSRRGGHGLGMQIVRELVASSGGELTIYSRIGAGTRIEIQWPLVVQQTTRQIKDERWPERIPPASANIISPKNFSQDEAAQGNREALKGAVAC